MNRRPSPLALLASAVLAAGCLKSDPQALQLLEHDDYQAWPWATTGGGGATDLVAYSRESYDGNVEIRVLRHDAAQPDRLESLGEVNLGTAAAPSSIVVSGTTVLALLGPTVIVVEAGAGPLATSTLSLYPEPNLVTADDRWLLAASGSTLTLIDRTSPTSRASLDAPADVTALLPTGGSFLAFTTAGFVHVTPALPTPGAVAVADANVRGFRSVYGAGVEALAAGPATKLASRIARLDLSDPAAPAVRWIAEVPGAFYAFAWDGEDTAVLALEETEPGSTAPWVYEAWVLRERNGGPVPPFGIPLPGWRPGTPNLAAHAGDLFVVGGPGFGHYRLAR